MIHWHDVNTQIEDEPLADEYGGNFVD